MNWQQYIQITPGVRSGKPCIAGTRITPTDVLEYLAGGTSQAVNLGTGRGRSVREVLSAIKRVTGREVPSRTAPPRAGDPPELVADPTRAENLLNWKAKRSLDEIVATAWKWDEHVQTAGK